MNLADQIRRAANTAVVRLAPRQRLGTVVTTSPLTITLGGDTTAVPATPVTGYRPLTGDTVVALVTPGAVPLVLGGAARPVVYQADVVTSQTTASTSYVDLATAGPSLVVPMLAGETILVAVSFRGNNASGAGHAALMSFAVSGADTVAAADDDGAENDDSVTATVTRWSTYTAASTGDHTITAKYRTIASGTSTFASRRLIVHRV